VELSRLWLVFCFHLLALDLVGSVGGWSTCMHGFGSHADLWLMTLPLLGILSFCN